MDYIYDSVHVAWYSTRYLCVSSSCEQPTRTKKSCRTNRTFIGMFKLSRGSDKDEGPLANLVHSSMVSLSVCPHSAYRIACEIPKSKCM